MGALELHHDMHTHHHKGVSHETSVIVEVMVGAPHSPQLAPSCEGKVFPRITYRLLSILRLRTGIPIRIAVGTSLPFRLKTRRHDQECSQALQNLLLVLAHTAHQPIQ